jgi:hypothetical protein
MATITVCPPDTIEALEAAPVAWLWDPRETTHLDKLARETIAGLNQPPPCDDTIGDDGEEECASCQALGSWEEEGALAYPLCPACKAQAAAEAQAEPPPEGWPGDLSDLDLLDPVRMEQIITNARAHFEAGTWPRIPAPFGGDE